jgi:uncharacterized membrane protein
MKNIYLGAFATVTMLLALSSCSKETQVALEPGTAKVMGLVRANTNEANDTFTDGSAMVNANGDPIKKWELAPTGTVVTFTINSRDLDFNPQAGFPYKDLIYTAQTAADGTYSVDLPAYETPINVDIMFNDFDAQVTMWGLDPADTTAAGLPATVQRRYSFSKSAESKMIYDKGIFVVDADYMKN